MSECNKCKWNNPVPVSVILIPFYKEIKLNHNAELLYIKRRNEPEKGKYALPGGFVNEREHPKDAAAREAYEETSIELNPNKLKLMELTLSYARNQLIFFYSYSECINKEYKAGDDALEVIAKGYDKDFISSIAFQSHKNAITQFYSDLYGKTYA